MSLILNKNIQEQATIEDFTNYWSGKYKYALEALYEENIGKPLSEASLTQLFIWKNGGILSKKKMKSLQNNYPSEIIDDLEERYLDENKPGGAIWNIFYLHCVDKERWPIFDQHTYRAMYYMKNGEITEIPKEDAQKYTIYKNEYLEFFNDICSMNIIDKKKVDKALFAFGKYLKRIKEFA